jgi:hypothetical protein
VRFALTCVRHPRYALLIGAFFTFVAVGVWLLQSPEARAKFGLVETVTTVAIDGDDFGVLEKVRRFEDLGIDPKAIGPTQFQIRRNFVTEASLYNWASRSYMQRAQVSRIEIVTKTIDGHVLARHSLQGCRPLTWSVEHASMPGAGYHERVDIVVQNVTQL